jgi:hypothetical protein
MSNRENHHRVQDELAVKIHRDAKKHRNLMENLYSGQNDIEVKETIFGSLPFAENTETFVSLARYMSFYENPIKGWRGQSNIANRVDSGLFRALVNERLAFEPQELEELSREDSAALERNMRFLESRLIEDAYTHFRNLRDLTDLELLATLQHYGAATRLLDLSENILIALWFACNSSQDTDGVVIGFSSNVLTPIEDTSLVKEKMDSILAQCRNCYFWRPAYTDDRMRAQQSIFLFAPCRFSSWSSLFHEPFDQYDSQNIRRFHAIGIKKELKKEILNDLSDIFGYKYASLFPDLAGYSQARAIGTYSKPRQEPEFIDKNGNILTTNRENFLRKFRGEREE